MKFEKKPRDDVTEFIVKNKKGQSLGDIAKQRGKWLFFPWTGIDAKDCWFGESCLAEIQEFLRQCNNPNRLRK